MAMNKPALDKLLDKADSKYALIIMGAKRARQITEHSPEMLEGGTVNPVSIALKEISEGKVHCIQTGPAAPEKSLSDEEQGLAAETDVCQQPVNDLAADVVMTETALSAEDGLQNEE